MMAQFKEELALARLQIEKEMMTKFQQQKSNEQIIKLEKMHSLNSIKTEKVETTSIDPSLRITQEHRSSVAVPANKVLSDKEDTKSELAKQVN